MNETSKWPEPKIPKKGEVIAEGINSLIESQIIKVQENQKETISKIYEEIFVEAKQLEIKGLYIPDEFLEKCKRRIEEAGIEILNEDSFKSSLRNFIFKIRRYRIEDNENQ